MREDYIAALDPYLRAIPTHLNNRYRLDLLGVEAARMAVQRPAHQAQVEFTDAAAQKLVDDLRRVQVQRPDGSMEAQLGQYVEPVQLQVVCYRLWQNLAPGQSRIDEEDIARTGDVNQSLSKYYAERVMAIAGQTGVRERSIRNWFEHRLITEGGIRGQVLMSPEHSGDLENQVIRLLEDTHLVRAEKRRGATWFELAHDRLIDPVRRNNAAWFQDRLSPLQRQAELWEHENRPNHLLLREQALVDAETWAIEHPDELTPTERDYLTISQEAQQRELVARQVQARELEMAQKLAETEKQRAEDQARSARNLRWLVAGLGVVLLMAIGLAILASSAQRAASANAQEAANQAATATRALATATYALGESQIQSYIAATALQESRIQGTRAAEQAAIAQAASTQAIMEKNSAATAQGIAEDQRATAVFSEQRIKEQANQVLSSLSSQLAAQGLQELKTDPALAALLGVEAFRAFDTPAARNLLLSSLELSQQRKISSKIIPESQQIYSLAVSPDGDRFAYGLGNGEIVLWSVSADRRVNVFPQTENGQATALAFSQHPGEIFLAAGYANGLIQLRNLETKKIYTFRPSSVNSRRPILDLAFHPVENWLAVPFSRSVYVYDVDEIWGSTSDQLPRKRQFYPNAGNVTSLAWSPDGRYLATGDDQKSVQVWDRDLEKKPIIGPFKNHQEEVSSVAWSPDGKLLASSSLRDFSDTQIVVLRFPSGEKEKNFKLQDRGVEVKSLSFSPDGQVLAVGNYEGKVFFWDTNSWLKIGEDLLEFEGPNPYGNNNIQKISFLPSPGQNLLAAAQIGGQIGLYTVNLQQGLVKDVAQGLGGAVLALSAQPGGGVLAAVRQDEGIQVVEINPDGGQRNLTQIDQPALSAAFSPDGRSLALGDAEYGRAAIYAVESGDQVQQVLFLDGASDRAQVLSLAFSQDGGYLAGSLCRGVIEDGDICRSPEGPFIQVVPLAENGGTAYYLQAPNNFILYPLAFAPGGLTLASGSSLDTLIWDVASNAYGNPLPEEYPVSSLSYHPDGSMLAAGYADARLRFWDTAAGSLVGPPLSGSPARFSSLAFSPQGDKIYTGLENGTIQVWNLDPATWIERACQIAGRNLTPSELEQFFPNQDPRETCPQPPG